VTHPDVIGDDRPPRRFGTVVAVLVAVGVAIALIVKAVGSTSSAGGPAPASSASAVAPTGAPSISGSDAPPTLTAATFPGVFVLVGSELREVLPAATIWVADLPADARDVWATTLPPDELQVHVFGVAGGNAFEQDVGASAAAGSGSAANPGRYTLGPATDVLQSHEYPVLVRAGEPVVVDAIPGQAVDLPRGWQPAGFANLGYAGIITTPAAAGGVDEIATWFPGGIPQILTQAGRLVGVTDGGQAVWLGVSCPAGPSCALFFGDIGGVRPRGGLRAPPGTRYFMSGSMAYSSSGFLAMSAERTGDGGSAAATQLIVLAEPSAGTREVVAGSEGAVPGAGMIWADGRHLIFAIRHGAKAQLMSYDVDAGRSLPIGSGLPLNVRLLTSFGATDSVTLRP
jgi:hypothetical protein